MNIQPTLSAEVLMALNELGRTEDINFSPDGRRLAIAGFTHNKILILELDHASTSTNQGIAINNFVEIVSPGLKKPHGLTFLDDNTVLVVNREGGASVLKLPLRSQKNQIVELPDLEVIQSDLWLYSPGSVATTKLKNGQYAVLICNNYAHYVSRHLLDLSKDPIFTHNEILLANGLDIPDGVAISSDNRWIAVSNHMKQCICLFENTPQYSLDKEPSAILEGMSYPHGIHFAANDRYLVVADAGAPFLHVYEQKGDGWAGKYGPTGSFRVMNDESFKLGHGNPQEGGPKGIDINEDQNMLVTTNDRLPLAFFNLQEVLNCRCKVESSVTPVSSYGSLDSPSGANVPRTFPSIINSAFTALKDKNYKCAENLYRDALQIQVDDPKALHMLGVALYRQQKNREASRLIRLAGMKTHWQAPGILLNYSLALGARMLSRDTARSAKLRQDYDLWLAGRPCNPGYAPLVSIVLISCNQASYIEHSLDSIYKQTYPNLELIVVDDASNDGSTGIIKEKLQNCPLPHRFVTHRTSLGYQATLSKAIALTRGEYINPLHANNLFEPERIAQMVEKIARRDFEWGFSKCICIDSHNQAIPPKINHQARMLSATDDIFSRADTIGSAFLEIFNPTIASGNIFFSKSLYEKLGGFRNDQPNGTYDFCLRALWHSEPCWVSSVLYRYRLLEDNTALQSLEQPLKQSREEFGKLVTGYQANAMASLPDNQFAPSSATCGSAYFAKLLARGQIKLSPKALTDLDDEFTQKENNFLLKSDTNIGDGLNLIGYIRGEFGLAESTRTMAETCHTQTIKVNVQDAEGYYKQSNRSMDRFLTTNNDQRTTLFYMNPGYLEPVWRRYLDRGDLQGRRVIGYWYWEIDKFPKVWLPALELVDEIWVASEFVERFIKRVTSKPVIKIPHAIEVKLARPYQRSEFLLPDNRFLFLFNFDFNSSSDRKNPWATIEAFQRAFPVSEIKVGLVIKCFSGNNHPEKFGALQKLAEQDPRIILLNRLLSRDEMYGLQSVCDAYVSLHRSEGLGLGMAECMAMGKPVIGTGYSGNLEFMNNENSCLVDYTLIPVKPGQYCNYEPGQMWANPDVYHAAAFMVRLFKDIDYRHRISVRASADMAIRYSHQVVGKIIKDRLDKINSQYPANNKTMNISN